MNPLNKKEFSYNFRLEPKDMFKYYMLRQYSSVAGVVQIIFTISMIILIFAKWSTSDSFFQTLMILGTCLFPIFQPIAIYGRSVKEFDEYKPANTISFDNSGMKVKVIEHVQVFSYQSLRGIMNKPGMILINPDDKHLYILPDRVTQDEKKELLAFLREHMIKDI